MNVQVEVRNSMIMFASNGIIRMASVRAENDWPRATFIQTDSIVFESFAIAVLRVPDGLRLAVLKANPVVGDNNQYATKKQYSVQFVG